jgi:signal transduction histidine kinase
MERPGKRGTRVIAVAIVGFTLLAALQTWRSGDADARVRFARQSERALETLLFGMRAYVSGLSEARGLFVFGVPDRAAFSEVVAAILTARHLPGLQRVGFAERLRRDQLDAAEARERAAGNPAFRVWPREPPRPEYTAVALVEPLDERSRRALGFDMLSDPSRRAAMERARDTSQPALTEKLLLLPDNEGVAQPGFVLFLPVYRRGAPAGTAAERRAALLGWLYTAFRSRDLFVATLGEAPLREVSLQVFDGPSADLRRLLFETGEPPHPRLVHPRPPLRTTASLEVSGRTWTMAIEELPGAGLDPFWQAALVLIAGGAVSALMMRTAGSAERHLHEQRALLDKEQAARLEAQRAVHLRDEVLAVVSHDLRNPLNAVVLGAQVLGKLAGMEQLPAAQRAMAERAVLSIRRSTERMQLLLGDLLDLARLETGPLSIERNACDAAALLREAVDLQLPLAEQRGVTLALVAAAGLPRISCDRSRVLQIFANLIGNALKFTPAGGRIEVRASSLDGGEAIELAVADTGCGIDPAHLAHVFDRYWQAERSDRHGVGLGLFIVRSLVEAQGGRIAVESAPGKGSVFRFTLPMAPGAPCATPPEASPAAAAKQEPAGPSATPDP